MVWTIYEILENINLNTIEKKLHSKIKPKLIQNDEGDPIKLRSAMKNIVYKENIVRGIYKYEVLADSDTWDDGKKKSPVTKKIEFTFKTGSMHLFINTNPSTASKLVDTLSEIIFKNSGDSIINKTISIPKLNNFLIDDHCEQLDCSWRELKLLNLSTSRLSGNSLKKTTEYKHYDSNGIKNSVLFRHPYENITMRINKKGSISVLTNITRDQIEDIITRVVLPLCQ